MIEETHTCPDINEDGELTIYHDMEGKAHCNQCGARFKTKDVIPKQALHKLL